MMSCCVGLQNSWQLTNNKFRSSPASLLLPLSLPIFGELLQFVLTLGSFSESFILLLHHERGADRNNSDI
jgi:hypothetical protein